MRSIAMKSAFALLLGTSLPMTLRADITESTPPGPAGSKDFHSRHSPYEPGNYQMWRRVHGQPSTAEPPQQTQLALAKGKRSAGDEAMVAEALNTLANVEKTSATPASKPAPKRRWMFWRKESSAPASAPLANSVVSAPTPKQKSALTQPKKPAEQEVQQVAAQVSAEPAAAIQTAASQQASSPPKQDVTLAHQAKNAPAPVSSPKVPEKPVAVSGPSSLPPPPRVKTTTAVTESPKPAIQLPFPDSTPTTARKAPSIPQSVADKYRTKWSD